MLTEIHFTECDGFVLGNFRLFCWSQSYSDNIIKLIWLMHLTEALKVHWLCFFVLGNFGLFCSQSYCDLMHLTEALKM